MYSKHEFIPSVSSFDLPSPALPQALRAGRVSGGGEGHPTRATPLARPPRSHKSSGLGGVGLKPAGHLLQPIPWLSEHAIARVAIINATMEEFNIGQVMSSCKFSGGDNLVQLSHISANASIRPQERRRTVCRMTASGRLRPARTSHGASDITSSYRVAVLHRSDGFVDQGSSG